LPEAGSTNDLCDLVQPEAQLRVASRCTVASAVDLRKVLPSSAPGARGSSRVLGPGGGAAGREARCAASSEAVLVGAGDGLGAVTGVDHSHG